MTLNNGALSKIFSSREQRQSVKLTCDLNQWRTQEFCSRGGGGVQQIQLRTEYRENGDLGVGAP